MKDPNEGDAFLIAAANVDDEGGGMSRRGATWTGAAGEEPGVAGGDDNAQGRRADNEPGSLSKKGPTRVPEQDEMNG